MSETKKPRARLTADQHLANLTAAKLAEVKRLELRAHKLRDESIAADDALAAAKADLARYQAAAPKPEAALEAVAE